MNGKIKILLVEDNETVLRMYQLKFELEDFKVYIAKDGEEALNALKKVKPNIMLVDIIMPNLDGFQFLEMAKGKKIPAIVLTSLDQRWGEERGRELGVADYLIKSKVTPELVVKKVKKVLSKKKK